jgi:hypothetical protein
MTALPTVALYASEKEIKNAHEILHHPHMCIRCNQSFDLVSNLGSHKCYQHPGFVNNGRWTCCDKPFYNLFYSNHFKTDTMFSTSINMPPYPPPVQARGCQPCDHTIHDKKWSYKDTERLHKIAGLIPFLNKKSSIEHRSGFSVVKINSQKMPVLLRCAKRWIKWPDVNTEVFELIYYNKNKPFQFVYVEINYRTLAGELQQLTYNEDEWKALTDDAQYIKGEFISAYYVFQHVDNDGSLKEDKVKKKITDLI